MLKAVIFDFDDTLVRSGRISFVAHCRAAVKLGWPAPSFPTFLKFWGKPWHAMIMALFPYHDVNEFIRVYQKTRANSRYPVIPGALDTINFLHEHHIELGILSNKPIEQLHERISHTALNPKIFSFIFGEQSTQYQKPDSRVFDEVLFHFRKHNIRKHEMLFVGDLIVDYFAARGAGIDFCGVLSGFHSSRKFQKVGLDSNHLIPSVKYLPDWLIEHHYLKQAHGKGF
ncbi:MAG: HAD family hydrolase [Candidatus Diapherotrites archaeon]